jgi:YihY family inner membrane protein
MFTRIRNFVALLPRLGVSAWKKFSRDNCSQIAAGVSYYVLFALVPLCIFGFSLLSTLGAEETQEEIIRRIAKYVGVDETDVTLELDDAARAAIAAEHGQGAIADIEAELEEISDPGEDPDQRADVVQAIDEGDDVTVSGYELEPEQIDVRFVGVFPDAIRTYGSSLGGLPIISLVLVAMSGSIIFSAYSRALNHIWKVTTLRFMVYQKLLDLATLLVAGLLLLVSVVASGVIGALRSEVKDATGGWIFQGDVAWAVLLFAVPLFVSFLFCTWAYMFLPRKRNSFRDVWLGAVVGAVGLEGLKFGYSIYVAFISGYDDAYGAFGAVLLWLFFVYLSSYLFLLGAEVAYVYPRLRDGIDDEALLPDLTEPAQAL